MTKLLTTAEAAATLNCSRRLVTDLIAQGKLAAVRIGARTYRISAAALDAYITAQTKPATTAGVR